MPVRQSCVFAVMLFSASFVAAQAPNPHAAIPGPQQVRPAIQAPANVPAGQSAKQSQSAVESPNATAPANTSAGPASQTAEAPLRPAQMPPKPPRISFVGGQLTVVANNSTLADVLNGIRSATGIKIEGLTGGGDRVYGQFGPAFPRGLIDSLLSGSHYDFILLGSVDSPDTVQRVILSPRTTGPAGVQTAGNQPRLPARPSVDDDNDATLNPDELSDDQPPPGVPPAPVQQPQPPGIPSVGAAPAQNQPQNGTQQPGVKTPEQLLEELRRLNQGRQQSGQNGQNDGPRPPQQPPDIVPR